MITLSKYFDFYSCEEQGPYKVKIVEISVVDEMINNPALFNRQRRIDPIGVQ